MTRHLPLSCARLRVWLRRALAALAVLVLGGCSLLFPADEPIALESYPGSGQADTLLVMLPGITDRASDFRRHGFIEAARRQGVEADIVLAEAHFGYYLSHNVVRRLEADLIEPARARGYRRIWLVGVSLGGLGSFLYTMEHPERIDGIVAVAPYLGGEGFVEELDEAGGVQRWSPPKNPPSAQLPHVEPRLWSWLKGYEGRNGERPPVILAYGEDDRYAEAHRQLARLLPPSQVITAPGGHGWSTWSQLWQQVLAQPAFAPAHATTRTAQAPSPRG